MRWGGGAQGHRGRGRQHGVKAKESVYDEEREGENRGSYQL